jgi:ferredoxin
MKRKIINIDDEKCNGCGLCAEACHEAAIGIVDGKAKLLREDFCDGLGNCLPVCPTGAISFEEREAVAYNETAVKENQSHKAEEKHRQDLPLPCGCPGINSRTLERPAKEATKCKTSNEQPFTCESFSSESFTNELFMNELRQWPIQIKLVPVNAPYFNNAHLLVAADCAAYAYGNFHRKFMKNKITLIGCPKLDNADYSKKLNEIISNCNIKSLTVVRMAVPCCSGIEQAAVSALKDSGKFIPWQVATLTTDGEILED